jgi:hypothetical protein
MNSIFSFLSGLGVQVYIYIALVFSSFGAGFYVEHLRFANFKNEIVVAAKTQETKNESIVKQQDLVTKGIQNEYESKLAAVHNFYASGVRNPSSGSMSGISPAPKGTDAETAYPILAEQCAATTAQLTSLQDWVNGQVGIK